MSTHRPDHAFPTAPVRIGLVLAVPLALGDLVAAAALVGDDAGGTALGVLAGLAALGTLAVLSTAWRGSRWAQRTVVATRLLGALTALPAFVVEDVPPGLVVTAAVTVALAVAVAVLVLRPARVPA